jgi:hypothetical protein
VTKQKAHWLTNTPVQQKELPIPDWVVCEAKPIHGLDLLGLRLPAQSIGVSLLSGVTTISPTIRYCRGCGVVVTSKTSHADHTEPVNRFANLAMTNDLDNIQTLCLRCHDLKTARDK